MLFREEDEDLEILPFADRADAGRLLANKLQVYAHRNHVVVVGLARGGLVVGSIVARLLQLPIDVLAVGKIRCPGDEELGIGAVADGGVRILDLSIIEQLCISDEEVDAAASAAGRELRSREGLYGAHMQLEGMNIILVDDGIATGCTMLAAVVAVRQQRAASVIVAVPATPTVHYGEIRMQADNVVTVVQPEALLAVSQCYRNFEQVNDQTVLAILRRAGREPLAA